jgi:hypothetical protein
MIRVPESEHITLKYFYEVDPALHEVQHVVAWFDTTPRVCTYISNYEGTCPQCNSINMLHLTTRERSKSYLGRSYVSTCSACECRLALKQVPLTVKLEPSYLATLVAYTTAVPAHLLNDQHNQSSSTPTNNLVGSPYRQLAILEKSPITNKFSEQHRLVSNPTVATLCFISSCVGYFLGIILT